MARKSGVDVVNGPIVHVAVLEKYVNIPFNNEEVSPEVLEPDDDDDDDDDKC